MGEAVTAPDGHGTDGGRAPVPPGGAARERFGHDVLGPVTALYLQRLLGAAQSFGVAHQGALLFTARAGVRIARALRLFAETAGRPLPGPLHLFWTSRVMTAKGIWTRDRAAALGLLTRELGHLPLGEVVAALLRHEGLPAGADLPEALARQPGHSLGAFLSGTGPVVQAVETSLAAQARRFARQLDGLMGGRTAALLVDTGWQGTAQRLLAQGFPEIDWWGAYFGVFGGPDTDRSQWPQMLGLMIAEDQFSPQRPETAVILHRHLIECLFEPGGESIEQLVETQDGDVVAPEAAGNLAEPETGPAGSMFAGVMRYLAALPDGRAPAAIARAGARALQTLAEAIVFPDRETAELCADLTRSADFGRTIKVPVLLAPRARAADDSADRRITDALWPAGQAALEYPPALARPIQRKLAGLGRSQTIGPVTRSRPSPALHTRVPQVAVITRTLDRPVFLQRALASVAAQTFGDYVHVVVNDGGDIEIAREAIRTTPCDRARVVLVDNVVNRGMEAASNIAIGACESALVVIHDDDDTWEPDFLQETTRFLASPRRPPYGGVITRTTYVSEAVSPDGIVTLHSKPYEDWVDTVHLMQMAIGNFFPPIAFLFRRALYDRLGGYDERYPVLGDWDFNLRFLLEADIGVVPRALANYHFRDGPGVLAFANSVIGDRDKHLEYSALVRNNLVRRLVAEGRSAAATLIGLGMHTGAQIGMLQGMRFTGGGGDPQAAARAVDRADAAWVAFQRLASLSLTGDMAALRSVGLAGPGPSPGRRLREMLAPAGRAGRAEAGLPAETLDLAMAALGRHAPARALTAPPDFDEATYLRHNPDVAAAVAAGHFASGFAHYWLHGRSEGRPRPSRS